MIFVLVTQKKTQNTPWSSNAIVWGHSKNSAQNFLLWQICWSHLDKNGNYWTERFCGSKVLVCFPPHFGFLTATQKLFSLHSYCWQSEPLMHHRKHIWQCSPHFIADSTIYPMQIQWHHYGPTYKWWQWWWEKLFDIENFPCVTLCCLVPFISEIFPWVQKSCLIIETKIIYIH